MKIKGIFKGDKDKGDKDAKSASSSQSAAATSHSSSKRQCSKDNHVDTAFTCTSNNCEVLICRLCAKHEKIDGVDTYICANCLISMKAFADDDMDFGGDDEEVKDFGGGGMVMTGKVSIDRDSGQVTGWDTIWSLIREENEKKPGDDQKDAAKKKV